MWYRRTFDRKIENLNEYFNLQRDLITGRECRTLLDNSSRTTTIEADYFYFLTNQDKESYVLHLELRQIDLGIEVLACDEKIAEKEIGRAKTLADTILRVQRNRKQVLATK